MLSIATGGLLAIEAIAIGMADPYIVFHEAEANFEVILLCVHGGGYLFHEGAAALHLHQTTVTRSL